MPGHKPSRLVEHNFCKQKKRDPSGVQLVEEMCLMFLVMRVYEETPSRTKKFTFFEKFCYQLVKSVLVWLGRLMTTIFEEEVAFLAIGAEKV